MQAPTCEIHATRRGEPLRIVLTDWLVGAMIDTNGLVASVTVPGDIFDSATEFSHAMIGNIRYEITKREIVADGWKLWLHTEDRK